MYIKEFRIKNFRNFDDAGVILKFHQGVNAIVGENNAGKSAIISALRIAVSIIQYKKDIYFAKTDFHLDAKGGLANEAQFDIYLADVPKYLIEIWKPGTNEGEFHIRFFLTKNEAGKERIKYSIWGGEVEGNQLSTDTLEAINLVYLGALRDAENEMRPNRNSKIANLLGALATTPEQKEDLVNELVKANNALLQKEPISKIREIINKNLVSIEHEVLHQQIDIGFIDPKFDSIASSLRTWILPRWSFVDKTSKYFPQIMERCSTHKDLVDEDAEGIFLDVKKYSEIFEEMTEGEKLYLKEISKFSFDLFQNGLGYNNLLFISTVLGDMSLTQDDILLNLLLAEEPEAHLHPQLQSLIYQFFKEQIEKSSSLQIIFTTHSPTLTSQLKIDTINVLCNYNHRTNLPEHIVNYNFLLSQKKFMQIIQNGGVVKLHSTEWVNKSSGKGNTELIVDDGNGIVKYAYPYWFPFTPYKDVFPRLFPWADFSSDEDFFENDDESLWRELHCYYDKEDGEWIIVGDTFEEFRSKLNSMRSKDHSGEVVEYMMTLSLNDLGRSFLAVDEFVSKKQPYSGTRPEEE